MYPCVRLTHTLLLYNQSDGLHLSEQFSLVICYFKTIFFVYQLLTIATRHCVALQRLITLLSFFLHCITLCYSCPPSSPHIKVIFLRSTTLGGHVIFIHFPLWKRRLLKRKTKSFLIITKLSSKIYLYFNTSIRYCLQLLYLTLTLLGYRLLLVCSLITGWFRGPAFAAIS